MTDPRHRAPPPSSRPEVARWIWVTGGTGAALVAGTVALASWLSPSPDVKPAAPGPTVARSMAVRSLPPLNVPTPPAPVTPTTENLLSSSRSLPGVSVHPRTTLRPPTARTQATTAHPRPQLPPATVPSATPKPLPPEPTPQQPAPTPTTETPVQATEEATPTTAESTPTVTPTDVVEEIVEDVAETPTEVEP